MSLGCLFPTPSFLAFLGELQKNYFLSLTNETTFLITYLGGWFNGFLGRLLSRLFKALNCSVCGIKLSNP